MENPRPRQKRSPLAKRIAAVRSVLCVRLLLSRLHLQGVPGIPERQVEYIRLHRVVY